jgi:hypothetical protein
MGVPGTIHNYGELRPTEFRRFFFENTIAAKTPDLAPRSAPDLSISAEKLCFLIVKAREFGAKDVLTDPDGASNATDDGMASVLEDHGDDPVVQEITSAMSEDEKIDLVALIWLGRGDGGIDDWTSLRAEAARGHNNRTASYLLGRPLVADYLAKAMSQFEITCDE